MAGMSAKGPMVSSSEEAELLACRKSVEFAIDSSYSELVLEGDNGNVMKAIVDSQPNTFLMGNVVDEVRWLLQGLQQVEVCYTKRGGNTVAHALAQHARNISNDVYWIENSPPPALEALFYDSLNL